MDFAITPSASQADAVACIVSHPDFMSSVVSNMAKANSAAYGSAQTSNADLTVRACTTCSTSDCPTALPTPSAQSSGSSGGASGALIGGVIAAVVIVALVIVAVVVVRRRNAGAASVKGAVSYKASAGREGTVSFENPMYDASLGGEGGNAEGAYDNTAQPEEGLYDDVLNTDPASGAYMDVGQNGGEEGGYLDVSHNNMDEPAATFTHGDEEEEGGGYLDVEGHN